MGTPEPLVDLGMDYGVTASGPSSMPWRTSWRVAAPRLRLPVLLVLVLALCAASASALASPLRLVARIPVASDASAMIEGDTLYVYDQTHGIRAYGLADGRLRWSAKTIELASETTVLYAAGRVIVSMNDTDAAGEHTVAFDAVTGRRLWTSDDGSAQLVGSGSTGGGSTAGILVQAKARPAGFNYPGTPQSGSLRLLDPVTGTPQWTYDTPVNCVVEVAAAIVELCPNTSQLLEIGLADGRPATVRPVPLGDAAVNFLLPAQDQFDDPRLFVAGDTVLVAHADTPVPVIDAYAMTGLRPLWTGLPIVVGQSFDQCGTALCLTNGPAAGTAVDLRTGEPVAADPPGAPADGALVLLPAGSKPETPSPLMSVGPGTSASLADPQVGPPLLLARWSGGKAAPIDAIADAGTQSCAEIAGYLTCTTAGGRITVWSIR